MAPLSWLRPENDEPPQALAALARGSLSALCSRPNCNAGWNGAFIPINLTGFWPNRLPPKLIFNLLDSTSTSPMEDRTAH